MKRILGILAALLVVALVGAPALAQPSPVEEVLPDVEEEVLDEAPEGGSTDVASGGSAAPSGTAGLPRTGIEVTTGAALAGALILSGGVLLLVARRRAAGSA